MNTFEYLEILEINSSLLIYVLGGISYKGFKRLNHINVDGPKSTFDIPNLNNLETTQDAMIQSLEKSIEQIKS
ncbi:hypothetical protein EI200_07185 [Peribacillus simplex]|uniref:hypothetical protein n=1 Tax=Peribacillus simplex TaxID=1478 RepID=UPI000F63864E|nr:hypothetical protein [Peribacillus simplex]RRN72939.1 hypothetical protein EI200_07185 [Peribacillus simplex]